MPNFSGRWTLKDQVQALAAERWTGIPICQAVAWGYNNTPNMLGVPFGSSTRCPVQLDNCCNWLKVSVGRLHSAFIKKDGTLWTVGSNNEGQLGNNQVSASFTSGVSCPIQIGQDKWCDVSASGQGGGTGANSTHAIKQNGTLWGWGAGSKIGDGAIINKSSPVQIGALTTWSKVYGGTSMTFAKRTDNALFSWGANFPGGLGDGTTTYRSSPVQISGSWAKVDAGNKFGLGIKTDGTLWGWGDNTRGQLGDGSCTTRLTPVQIGVLTTWCHVTAGYDIGGAIREDGTLWTMGNNIRGSLGINTCVTSNCFINSPRQVGALTDWSSVDMAKGTAGGFTIAIKTNGTLWSWGTQGCSNRTLGTGVSGNRSSPVQVGSLTNWYCVNVGSYSTQALQVYRTN